MHVTSTSTPCVASSDRNSIPTIQHWSVIPEPASEALVSQEQIASRLRAAIKELPADQAEVLHKNFFEDKPHSEVAAELGLPLGTVKSRLRLALAKLRQVSEDFE